jgi:cell division GTPase FtsZ
VRWPPEGDLDGNVREADEILLHAVEGITDLIIMPGLVNSASRWCTTMSRAGMA